VRRYDGARPCPKPRPCARPGRNGGDAEASPEAERAGARAHAALRGAAFHALHAARALLEAACVQPVVRGEAGAAEELQRCVAQLAAPCDAMPHALPLYASAEVPTAPRGALGTHAGAGSLLRQMLSLTRLGAEAEQALKSNKKQLSALQAAFAAVQGGGGGGSGGGGGGGGGAGEATPLEAAAVADVLELLPGTGAGFALVRLRHYNPRKPNPSPSPGLHSLRSELDLSSLE
jgi:hypothetical protein